MPIADELISILGYRIEGEANLRKYKKGMDDAEVHAKRSADRLRKLGVASGAIATAGVAFTTAAVKDFAAFERQMNRIGITAGATADQTKNASDEVQRLAEDLRLPLDEAISAFDTLVASGKSMEEALEFLPSVLSSAQASGAAASDMANTAEKAASALKIEADQLQRAFDIMVTGGKAGQFELKDMAQYIPELANSFASLGYTGEEGLKRLIAVLQTVREDTGSAGAAATQVQNIFGKMLTEETSNKFAKFGIDIRKEMEAAKEAGEDALSAFVRISKEAIDGDLSKLPLLFTDQEFRLGMQSLITSEESLQKFLDTLNSAEVDGAVFRDLNRILGDTQSSIQGISSSWDQFMKAFGGAAAGPVSSGLDALTDSINRQQAITKSLEREGMGFWERQFHVMSNEEADRRARAEGFIPAGNEQARRDAKETPFAYTAIGRRPSRPISRTPTPGPQAASGAPADVGSQAMIEAGFDSLAERVEAMNSNLAEMTGTVAAEATITDARQDNRQFPVSVNTTVNQTITQPVNAPTAAGQAVGAAVGKAATDQASRIEQEPSF